MDLTSILGHLSGGGPYTVLPQVSEGAKPHCWLDGCSSPLSYVYVLLTFSKLFTVLQEPEK